MATVLVVDDMMNIRKFISLNLANSGHVVLEAENAEQALNILSEREPAVIVLDLALPEMDGWEFLTAITERYPNVATIPVILVTATVVEEGYKQDRYANIVDVILKPFDVQVLTAAIDRAVPRSQS